MLGNLLRGSAMKIPYQDPDRDCCNSPGQAGSSVRIHARSSIPEGSTTLEASRPDWQKVWKRFEFLMFRAEPRCRQPRCCVGGHRETAAWLIPPPSLLESQGGTLLPVYYVSPYQFVICMRWYTRAPTHTRTEHFENINLRNRMEHNGTRQTTRRSFNIPLTFVCKNLKWP